MEDPICDLCKNLCNGPIRYAHKPYMFRFYHDEEYERQVEKFLQKKAEIENDLREGSIETYTEDETTHSIEDTSNGSQLSDWTDTELYEVDELEEIRGYVEDGQNIREGTDDFIESELFDVHEEKEEEKESIEDEYLKSGVERERKESNLYDIEEEDEDESSLKEFEEWENVFEEDDEDSLVEQWKIFMEDVDEEVWENVLSSEFVATFANHSKSFINKHLDITIATSGAIMTALANVSEHTQDVTKTYTSFAIATVGIAVGIKGILTAARPYQPMFPRCRSCKTIPHPNTGCRPFCHLCGERDQGSNWKDGSQDNHCLIICNLCDKNCVLCETNKATVKKHHKDFCANVHGHASTRLSAGCRDGVIVGSSLLMAGAVTCATVPKIGWGLGAALIAGSILVCGAVRVSSALPNLRIRCHICHEEEDAEYYVYSEGCQSWCMCCGVFDNQSRDVGDKYCLQLCDDCAIAHD